MRKLLAAAVLAGSLLWATPGASSASSPYGCKNQWGNGTVCYQIVGSGDFVDFWQGANNTTVPVQMRLFGPSGLWRTINLSPHRPWELVWDQNALRGTWCADYTWRVPYAAAEICYQVK